MKVKFKKKALASTIALSLMSAAYSGATFAADFYLCAKQETITMSDGEVIPMWGFAPSTGGFADGCIQAIQVPGPELRVADNDSTLNIHVRNVGLPEPVSVVIPGQNATTMAPVMLGDRVRSFTKETVAGGPDQTYTWTSVDSGTYAYHSGTHPAVQVQMGLYGAMIKNHVDSPAQAYPQAYPGAVSTFDSEVTVFYSEIDPVLHNQVANLAVSGSGNAGLYATTAIYSNAASGGMTSTMEYKPQYFLVNGDDSSTSAPIAGAPMQTSLIRFINMGLQSHMPALHGDDFAVIAEDGYEYQYPRNQYSALVAAGQTRDVLFTPPIAGNYPLFDRVLNLTNKLPQPASSGIVVASAEGNQMTSPGSMVTILQVGTNADTDNVLDHLDNCLLIDNPNQSDPDRDGFGTACDADINNDGQTDNFDIAGLRAAFIARSQLTDFNGDGYVDNFDLAHLRSLFFKAPGPSGISN